MVGVNVVSTWSCRAAPPVVYSVKSCIVAIFVSVRPYAIQVIAYVIAMRVNLAVCHYFNGLPVVVNIVVLYRHR